MIYTSYFSTFEKLAEKLEDVGFASIAGYSPEWIRANLLKYWDLERKREWRQEWHSAFENNLESSESKAWHVEKHKDAVLSELTPERVAPDLSALAERADVCMLCLERPDKFCRRHIAAEWLNKGVIHCGELV